MKTAHLKTVFWYLFALKLSASFIGGAFIHFNSTLIESEALEPSYLILNAIGFGFLVGLAIAILLFAICNAAGRITGGL